VPVRCPPLKTCDKGNACLPCRHFRHRRHATLAQYPDSTVLIPRTHANPHGHHPLGPGTFDLHLRQWLTDIAVTDELGRPVKVTPHQFRHTYAT
jgi:integrase